MSTDRSTGELLRLGVDGDDEAWAELVERLSPAIWGAARSLRLDRAQAEDVFGTVWLRLVERHDTIRDPERLAGWIATTARNEGLAVIRHASRQRPTDRFDTEDASEPGPAASAEQRAVSELVWEGFAELDERCRELLRLLVAVPKVPYDVIGEQLDMKTGSIGPTRERCLRKLRATSAVSQILGGTP
ncbi:RNA polymerase sigma factor [Ilumatobacter sp.]|uniref:RNA polymerase sigma factor n=1 Tax=Ilumatobacter sp. TaxID=1967498 RepID=UPI003B528629